MNPNSGLPCVLALAAMLQACSGMPGLVQREPVTTVRVVNTMSYPELPDIPMPMEPTLIAWQYEVPRDLSKTEPRNSRECQNVQEKDRDDAYWDKCGVHPVIHDSNVLYGFDQRNWNIMLTNFVKLREYIVELKARIDVANELRREWRRKAEEERRKAASEGVSAVAAPAAPVPAPAPVTTPAPVATPAPVPAPADATPTPR
jgi:hypothetical protein